jgi:hypothetical protein
MKYWFIVLSTYADLNRRNEEHELILGALKKKRASKIRKVCLTSIQYGGTTNG